ncbi:MAG TPA: hypothetical protein VHN99_07125 [Deinococcales bacterium]|nr:hypothetical protein [Deinococcales bacterium]
MPFDWEEYCSFGTSLVASAKGSLPEQAREAAYRTACSRAYYGAFNVALRIVKKTWSVPEDGNTHRFVIDRFIHYSSRTAPSDKIAAYRRVGLELDRLRQYRNNADYDDDLDSPAETQAALAVKIAQNTLDELRKW